MQLAPATNEKSLCFQQLHHQNVVSYFIVAAGWKITTTNKPLGGKTVSGQKLCLGQNTEKDLEGLLWLHGSKYFLLVTLTDGEVPA